MVQLLTVVRDHHELIGTAQSRRIDGHLTGLLLFMPASDVERRFGHVQRTVDVVVVTTASTHHWPSLHIHCLARPGRGAARVYAEWAGGLVQPVSAEQRQSSTDVDGRRGAFHGRRVVRSGRRARHPSASRHIGRYSRSRGEVVEFLDVVADETVPRVARTTDGFVESGKQRWVALVITRCSSAASGASVRRRDVFAATDAVVGRRLTMDRRYSA